MEGTYGSGTYCKGEGDDENCRQLGELEDVLRNDRDYEDQLDAWRGWHSIAKPMRGNYTRFVELVNQGARDMGYRSEEHTSELQSLMRNSYAVFCLKKKK